ncbi:Uma2 family endonuclease [Actinocorallia populi]|uniref:Uma2 family endonuclease n=1 Tax=Actinocorallia populi TaxID=2079200 RepID=UPI001300ACE8|nr:Uma2 family endonuclease [Actinocorallia populi]
MINAVVRENTSIDLPDTPHALFVRGELADAVGAPEGARVEVVGGEVIVSPAPSVGHAKIVWYVAQAFARQEGADHEWECLSGPNLDLVEAEKKYGAIPDLVVGEAPEAELSLQPEVSCLVSDEVELVMEVTSPSNACHDRPPRDGRATKWNGYARAEVPYYLLVDRDPKVAQVVLYTIPDAAAGAYLDKQVWSFGEDVVLPDPFRLRIPTHKWALWG